MYFSIYKKNHKRGVKQYAKKIYFSNRSIYILVFVYKTCLYPLFILPFYFGGKHGQKDIKTHKETFDMGHVICILKYTFLFIILLRAIKLL